MTASPWRRLAAWLIDWAVVLGWVALTAAVGVPLLLAGVLTRVGAGTLNGISVLVLVVPVVGALSVLEAGARQATPGKRALGLRVQDRVTGQRVPLRRTIARNLLKVGLPWTLGHIAVIAIVSTSARSVEPVWVWLLVGAASVLPIAEVATLFLGSRRTLHDRATGTVVAVGERGVSRRGRSGRRTPAAPAAR